MIRKRNLKSILFINEENGTHQEMDDFARNIHARALYARNIEESIAAFHARSIDLVVLNLKSLSDAGILKYINEYHSKTKVIIRTNEIFDSFISVLNTGNFSVIHEPLKLSELRKQVLT
jgi:DNA-binding NtrC family response regulator